MCTFTKGPIWPPIEREVSRGSRAGEGTSRLKELYRVGTL